MSQLGQLLAQLDREGASELVVSTNRPVALRVNGTYQTLTSAAVTPEQLHWLIRGTEFVAMVAESEGVGELQDVEVEGRSVRAQVIRNGDDIMLRVESPKRAEPEAVKFAAPQPRPTPQPAAAQRPAPQPERKLAPQPAPPPQGAEGGSLPPTWESQELPRPPVRTHEAPRAQPQETPRAPQEAPRAQPQEAPRSRRLTVHPEGAPVQGLIDEPCEVTPALVALVRTARQHGATDLHIAAQRAIMIRTIGELAALEPTVRGADEVEAMLLPLLGPVRRRQLDERGYVDLAVQVPGAGLLRGNVSRQQGGLKGAFRLALAKPPTLDELGLPHELAKLTEHHQGLIVIAGPSGHGKTTTLAALVDLVNSTEPVHILTIEDPVEIEHPRKLAVVSQREVGRHTLSFAAALKASLREDPDVIVIGELRDRETVEIAMTAAETGHLVIATMSTPSAAKTIDRLIDMFPPDEQSQIRASLAGALRAIVAQRLLPSATGDSVVAAVELVVGVLPLATLIRDNKLFQLPNLMQRGKAFGMLRLDDSLVEHVRAGRITEDVALRAAESKKEMMATLHPEIAQAAAAAAKQTNKLRIGDLFGKKDKP